MPFRRVLRSRWILSLALSPVFAVLVSSYGDVPVALRPGTLGGGVTLLPNGWKIAPAGRHVQVGSLPLAMVESPDGRLLFIASNGYMKPAITIVDIKSQRVRDVLVLDHAWLGLAWHPDGRRLYVSGAGNNTVHELRWGVGAPLPRDPDENTPPRPPEPRLTRGPDLVLGRPMEIPLPGSNRPEPVPQSFIGGLAITPDGTRLFATHVMGQVVSVVDLKTGHVLRTIDLPAEPYTCAISPDGRTLFVSLWGGARVLLFDAATFEPRGEVAVGEHPNAMAITREPLFYLGGFERWRSPGTVNVCSSRARIRTPSGRSTWGNGVRSSRSRFRCSATHHPDRRRIR